MAINWAQVLFNSAITGSLYLLGSVGLTLTYGLSKFPNFAYAELITAGAFFGYLFAEQFGLGFFAALIISFVLGGILAFLSYRGIFQPLLSRGSSLIHLMVASIGLGYVVRHSLGAAWGWSPSYFSTAWSFWNIGPLRISSLWLWLIFTAVALALGMHLLLTYTKIGRAMRASSSNPELALASGINVNQVIWITWFISGGLAAIAGMFRAADTQIWPMTGWDIILPIFAVTILGGIGNYYGAIVAAFIIGLVENFGVVFLITMGLSTEYRVAIAFLILIGTLILRPQGLAMLFRRA